MKSLNSLVNLIKKLSSEELKTLFKFINYYNSKNNFSKSEELLKIILTGKTFLSNNIQNKLYGKQNNYAFNKLVERLNEKILEVIIFDSNISKKYYPDRVKVIFDLKKKLIQSDVLSLKGLREDADDICKKNVSKAEKYELFDIVMSALIIRQRFINIRKDKNELMRIQNGIEIAESKYKNIIKSQIVFNNIINKINVASENKSYFEELINSIAELEKYYGEFRLNIVKYYFLFLKIEYYQIKGEFNVANVYLTEILSLILNKSIYSENRMGTALLNISNNNINLYKFKEAIEAAEKAKKYFPNNIYNQALVNEYLFYSYFYQGKYKEAEIEINKLIQLPKGNITSFSNNKWKLFGAVTLFIKQDFLGCINLLNDIPEIDKDKEGWNINKRLLLIMSRIELGQLESADLQVVNLEKFLKRRSKNTDINFRYSIIIKILIKLINSNIDFNSTYKSRAKYFTLLNAENSDLKWKLKSPELINFTSWFNSRMEPSKAKYEHLN